MGRKVTVESLKARLESKKEQLVTLERQKLILLNKIACIESDIVNLENTIKIHEPLQKETRF